MNADDLVSDYDECGLGSKKNSMRCSAMIKMANKLLGIADAVEALSPGQTLVLPPGNYTGSRNCNVSIGKDNITIRSERGRGSVVIDCSYQSRHFNITGSHVHLDALVLTRGASTCPASHCTTQPMGGCILAGGWNLSISRSHLSECVADGSGGGVALSGDDSTLWMRDTLVDSCWSGSGGAIAANSSGILLESCAFENNSALESGGAVFVSGSGTLELSKDVLFSGNRAGQSGGAIYITQNKSVKFTGQVIFNDNQAGSGGAISADSDIFLSGTVCFTLNKANYSGGGIYVETGRTLSVAGEVKFERNMAGISGGAVFLSEKCNLFVSDRVVFQENIADVIAFDNQNTCIYCSSLGGAIYASDGSTLKIWGETLFKQNQVQGSTIFYGCGGAVYITSWGANSTLELAGSVRFTGNVAGANGSASNLGLCGNQPCATMYGGAICTDGSTLTQIFVSDAVSFDNNSAYLGGGISLNTNSDLELFGHGHLTNNTAFYSGGAIFAWGSLVSIGGSVVFRGNRAQGYDAVYSGGGAIYMECSDCGSLSSLGIAMYANVSFLHNIAEENGGALFVHQGCCSTDSANTTLASGRVLFEGNKASNDGGAVYILDSTQSVHQFEEGVLFRENRAEGNGGAIQTVCDSGTGPAIQPCLRTQDEVSFIGNTANKNGGAIAASNRFVLEILGDSSGSLNVAHQNGGFLFAEGGVWLKLQGNIILFQNQALGDGGALFGTSSSSITIQNGVSLLNNKASNGGAISLTAAAALMVQNHVRIANNEADVSGGAIICSGAQTRVNLENNVKIEFNKADVDGGAVFVQSQSLFLARNVNISENQALSRGGAICADSSEITLGKECLLFENRASQGGALFIL